MHIFWPLRMLSSLQSTLPPTEVPEQRFATARIAVVLKAKHNRKYHLVSGEECQFELEKIKS